jgi:hypothetical protein
MEVVFRPGLRHHPARFGIETLGIMVTTKPVLRFVPTLTEVVRPGAIPPTPLVDREALIEQVLQAVKPQLEQQMRAALHTLVEEQLRKTAPQWELDVQTAVKAAVAQALVQRKPPKI